MPYGYCMTAFSAHSFGSLQAIGEHNGFLNHHLKDVFIHVLSTCEQVQRTLKCGISEISGHPFCALGVICAAYNGDYVLAKELGETGLFLESLLMSSTYDETATNFISYAILFPWTRSLSSCCKELSRTCTLGMRSGNTEYATWAIILGEVILPFQNGQKTWIFTDEVPSVHTTDGRIEA